MFGTHGVEPEHLKFRVRCSSNEVVGPPGHHVCRTLRTVGNVETRLPLTVPKSVGPRYVYVCVCRLGWDKGRRDGPLPGLSVVETPPSARRRLKYLPTREPHVSGSHSRTREQGPWWKRRWWGLDGSRNWSRRRGRPTSRVFVSTYKGVGISDRAGRGVPRRV